MANPPVNSLQFPSGPLLDTTSGEVMPVWRAYFAQLYKRTGGSTGPDTDTVALVAERLARGAGDAALSAALAAERSARSNADSDEATARKNADTAETSARSTADILEASARAAADALLVPIAQLCSLWAGCNLSFLPTTDPGSGRPWLDGNHIAIGSSSTTLVAVGLEDASGQWVLEDGTSSWLWG